MKKKIDPENIRKRFKKLMEVVDHLDDKDKYPILIDMQRSMVDYMKLDYDKREMVKVQKKISAKQIHHNYKN